MKDEARLTGLIEALKEGGRLAFFAGVSVLVDFLLTKVSLMSLDENLVIVLTIGLRLLDKYLHEKNKLKNPGLVGESLGLVRF